MGIFNQVSQIVQSVDSSVKLANAAELAYHVGTGGDPKAFTPFTADEAQRVAMNLAGSYAVETAASVIAAKRNSGLVTEEAFEKALRDMAEGKLLPTEQLVARLCANLAWKSGQPFRSLDRVTRAPMVDFNLLSEAEKTKDDDQIQTAAQTLLELLGANVQA